MEDPTEEELYEFMEVWIGPATHCPCYDRTQPASAALIDGDAGVDGVAVSGHVMDGV